MLIWCLQQVKYFILKLPINGSFSCGTKFLNLLHTVPFFSPSVGVVDDMLVRLPLIEKIIKDVNFMWISFSVKHPQIFQEL